MSSNLIVLLNAMRLAVAMIEAGEPMTAAAKQTFDAALGVSPDPAENLSTKKPESAVDTLSAASTISKTIQPSVEGLTKNFASGGQALAYALVDGLKLIDAKQYGYSPFSYVCGKYTLRVRTSPRREGVFVETRRSDRPKTTILARHLPLVLARACAGENESGATVVNLAESCMPMRVSVFDQQAGVFDPNGISREDSLATEIENRADPDEAHERRTFGGS